MTSTTTTTTPAERPALGDRMRAARPRPVSPKWLQLAEARAMGLTVTEAAARAGLSRKAASKAMADPRFAGLLEAEERRQRAAAERALARHRAASIDELGAALTNPDLPPSERLQAAKVLIGASQPPSERMRDEARREVLGALPLDLRRRVAEALAGADVETLRVLSDEELARIAEGA